jgi:hypothetical protein
MSEAPADARDRAAIFIRDLGKRYEAYQTHKETMGYAGFAVYVAAFGTALVTKDWPPWGSKHLVVLGVTVAWVFVLIFVKWQLLRRRWAAIRVAGVERLLARWVVHAPTSGDLATWKKEPHARPGASVRIIDHIWPLKRAVVPVDVSQETYPCALVEAWRAQAADRGTAAISHERLVVVLGWLLWAAVLLRTVVA